MEQAQVVGIITQSDVLNYLDQHKSEIGPTIDAKIEDLGLYDPKKGVVTVTSDTVAMDAFQKMFKDGLSCVGIVDNEGVMVGNLSVSDLRGLNADRFSNLTYGVSKFLKIAKALSRPYATVLNSRLNNLRALAMKQGGTFKELLDLVVKNRVHRAYVIDDKCKPVAIITLSDILKHLSEA
eukprot:CAMPEP_0184503394 /NCGR_PEP_ID=MMETSP0113_2-20130426/51868_1 /TAXON_ID=91329 /ORGANISM="Norrisiella sphaerica, Strain BC52" /LENGTH=179 /DNA_ID=CAMNT_0026892887 /DNA_START=620 /DNA_END=1159 /DNA_ORIENTATION=-